MDHKNKVEAIREFTLLMFQKGYRGRFYLNLSGQRCLYVKDELKSCLEEIIKTAESGVHAKDPYELNTLTKDNIQCTFRVTFDEKEGFRVREMTVKNRQTRDRKSFYLVNNQLVMGSNGVSALFPKPKPWQHITKGKLRP